MLISTEHREEAMARWNRDSGIRMEVATTYNEFMDSIDECADLPALHVNVVSADIEDYNELCRASADIGEALATGLIDEWYPFYEQLNETEVLGLRRLHFALEVGRSIVHFDYWGPNKRLHVRAERNGKSLQVTVAKAFIRRRIYRQFWRDAE